MQMLDKKQLAELLGYEPTTVDKYWRLGKIPKPIKLFGKLLWDKAEVEKWLKKHTEKNS